MPFDPGLAARLEEAMPDIPGLVETRMFGGFGYLLDGNMCVGIHKSDLIVRLGVEQAEEALKEPGVRPMDLTGRVMKGWATITPEANEDDERLQHYVGMAIAFVETLPAK